MAMSITPEELMKYSVFADVIERPDEQLTLDILEAETYLNQRISQPLAEHIPLPPTLRLALLKIAQYFALVNSDESMSKGYKSEKIGDYSYTLADGAALAVPDISELIAEFVEAPPVPESSFQFRMRPL